MRRSAAALALASLLFATPALGQRRLTRTDSALVGRILLAEDRRDSASAVFADGVRHADERIRMLARRALARVKDPRFAGRDSFPAPVPPPAYADPAWRLRYRALTASRTDCAVLRGALADSAWPVRLRAADLAPASCSSDSTLTATLRSWASSPPPNGARRSGEVSWQAAAHAIVALARVAPSDARALLPGLATSRTVGLRGYAAQAAALLSDTALLRRMTEDRNDNVKEAAIEGLSRLVGHAADDAYRRALSARGYQAVRAAARALRGSTDANAVVPVVVALRRLRADASETSRDARLEVLARFGEFTQLVRVAADESLAVDFDCVVADSAARISVRLGGPGARCTPLPVTLPPDAVALALGREVRLRVVLADSSGGGSFVVRLRGDVAPIMAARVLALARAGWYNGLTWHRVEPDFVLQGGGTGASEYMGHPRFMRDELGSLAHQRGTIGMSTRGHDTGDGQWFVNLRDNPRLTRDYTVFAEVVEGIEVVDGVLEGDVIARVDLVPGP